MNIDRYHARAAVVKLSQNPGYCKVEWRNRGEPPNPCQHEKMDLQRWRRWFHHHCFNVHFSMLQARVGRSPPPPIKPSCHCPRSAPRYEESRSCLAHTMSFCSCPFLWSCSMWPPGICSQTPNSIHFRSKCPNHLSLPCLSITIYLLCRHKPRNS